MALIPYDLTLLADDSDTRWTTDLWRDKLLLPITLHLTRLVYGTEWGMEAWRLCYDIIPQYEPRPTAPYLLPYSAELRRQHLCD